MGDSKVIKKFQRLLAECEEGHVYQGTIIEFIKVDYVPQDRYSSGMLVTGTTGTQRVVFSNASKKYIKNASPFRIGDQVLILGKDNYNRPNSTIPSVILIPGVETAILSEEHGSNKFEGWVDYAQAGMYLLCLILGFFFSFGEIILTVLFGPIHPYPLLYSMSGLGVFIMFLLILLLEIYNRHAHRWRVLRCDPDTWNIMNDEINAKFGIIGIEKAENA